MDRLVNVPGGLEIPGRVAGQAGLVAPVRIHDVDIAITGLVGDEGDAVSIGRPHWLEVGEVVERDESPC